MNINLADVLPTEKASAIKSLWDMFEIILHNIKEKNEMENATASQWLQTFKTIYDTKYITPYIHAFTVHLPHMISKLRNLNINICHIACDSLEKKHGLLKQQYFHRTNRGGLGRNPDIQILEIQRILFHAASNACRS